MRRVKAKDFRESELLVPLAPGGAGTVLRADQPGGAAGDGDRWVEALLAIDQAGDALASMARRTEDPVRDLAPVTLATVRRRLDCCRTPGVSGCVRRRRGAARAVVGTDFRGGVAVGAAWARQGPDPPTLDRSKKTRRFVKAPVGAPADLLRGYDPRGGGDYYASRPPCPRQATSQPVT